MKINLRDYSRNSRNSRHSMKEFKLYLWKSGKLNLRNAFWRLIWLDSIIWM
jgi:hypothetical protein